MNDDTAIQNALAALASNNLYERLAAIDTLAKARYAEGVERIIELTHDTEHEVQETAIWALGDIGSPAATERLRELAEKPIIPNHLRWAAIHSLGMIGDLSALPGLFHIYYEDDYRELRQAAGRGILRYGENAVQTLVQVLTSRDHEGVAARTAAAQLLGRIGAVGAISNLIDAISQDEPNVRWDAVKALGDIGDESAVPFLIDLLESDDVILGKVAVWALETISTPEAIEAASRWREENEYTDHSRGSDNPLLPPPRPNDFDPM